MEFCDKCGGVVMPRKAGAKVVMACRSCGKEKTTTLRKDFKLSTDVVKPEAGPEAGIVVVEKKTAFEALPKTKAICPKCEHKEAFWWMQQTRSGDEPPTRFMKCTKCNHVWREYE